jgi:hypothetical protein
MRYVGLIVFSAVLAGCGSSTDTDAQSPRRVESNPAGTISSPAASQLEGTWRTDLVTVDDLVRTLREHDLAEWVGRFRANSPVSKTPTSLMLEISDGGWDLYGAPRGSSREEIDYDAHFEVEGNTVVVTHEGDSNTYRWSVRGDQLTLEWQKTTYGPNNGIPEEVFQRALYMTRIFSRVR